MRILNVTAQKPDATGSGVYLAEMVRSEVALGHEAAVVCGLAADDEVRSLPGEAHVFAVRFDTPGLPFHVCGMSDTMPYAATRYRDLTPDMLAAFEGSFSRVIREAVEEFDPDLVICHHLYVVTALVRELVDDRPVVAICHSTCLRQLAQHGLERERIARAVRRLDCVYALHGAQREQIVEQLGVTPERVRVLGTGYNARVFHAGADTPRKPGRIVYAGKIWRKKGVESLLRAYAAMDGRGLDLRLAGGRGDDAEFEAIRRLVDECPWHVELLGRLSQADLAVEYRRAELFVLPSFYEGLPLVVIEALASGCKAVVTDLPGIRPWVQSNVPDAPVWWVRPPRIRNTDEPCEDDLPAFEGRLAAAMREALASDCCGCDVSALSWDALTARLLLDYPIDK